MRINRYLSNQLLTAMLFVVLGLSCVIWLSPQLRFLDWIVNRGLPLTIFLKLTVLLFPTWLSIVLPVACFASMLFIYNKLANDREIVVMAAAGISPMRIGAPAIAIAMVVTVISYLMSLYLMPTSYRAFKELQFQIRHNYTDLLIREGIFNTITPGVTVYVSERGNNGELRGIWVHDERDPQKTITLIAEKGALVVRGDAPRVFMTNGNRQSRDRRGGRVSLLYFERYTVDLGRLKATSQRGFRDQNEQYLTDLLNPTDQVTGAKNFSEFVAEGHYRLASPLLALAMTIIGLAVLLRGELSHRGQSYRLTVAIASAGAIEALGLAGKFLAAKDPLFIPLQYGAMILPMIIGLIILAHHRLPRPGVPDESALAAG